MKIGKNLLNKVPVEKSILADFDQFIILVNKWKAKGVHEGYGILASKKKHTHTQKRPQCRQYSLHLIYFFYCFELYLKCILRRIHSQDYKQRSNRLFEICFKTLSTDRTLNTFK